MSADNWAQCPQCVKEHKDYLVQRQALLKRSYGVVSADEYLQLKESIDKETREPQEDTLREDYEIGIYQGKFVVSYSSCCKTCGWDFQYKYETDPTSPQKGQP